MNNQYEQLIEFWLDNRRFQVVIAIFAVEVAGLYLLSDLFIGILKAFDMTEEAFIPLVATIILGSLYFLSKLFYQRDLSRESEEGEGIERVSDEVVKEEQNRLQSLFETLCRAAEDGDVEAVHHLKPFFMGDDEGYVLEVCDLYKCLLEKKQKPEIVTAIHAVIQDSQDLLSLQWPGNHTFYRNIALSGAEFFELIFKETDFVQADFSGSKLSKTEFIECELEEINLTASQCRETDFTVVDMNHGKLESLTCIDGNFLKVELDYVRCNNAVFEHVDFEEVSFNEADLTGVEFQQCRFEKTTFKETNLCGTNLETSEIGANVLFEGAKYDNTTKFPDGFDPETHGMIVMNTQN